jgi:hypothetical protein
LPAIGGVKALSHWSSFGSHPRIARLVGEVVGGSGKA